MNFVFRDPCVIKVPKNASSRIYLSLESPEISLAFRKIVNVQVISWLKQIVTEYWDSKPDIGQANVEPYIHSPYTFMA
jgi:hypothetical protein